MASMCPNTLTAAFVYATDEMMDGALCGDLFKDFLLAKRNRQISFCWIVALLPAPPSPGCMDVGLQMPLPAISYHEGCGNMQFQIGLTNSLFCQFAACPIW